MIADTHDFLDEKVFDIFDGVDIILHAGDIEGMEIIRRLEEIAPVEAVAGNHESEEVQAKYQWITSVDLGGVEVALTHRFLPVNVNSTLPLLPLKKEWLKEFGIENARGLVFGHAHEPANFKLNDVLYFNSGYAGPDMTEPMRTVGLIYSDGVELTGDVFFLNPPPRDWYLDRALEWPKAR